MKKCLQIQQITKRERKFFSRMSISMGPSISIDFPSIGNVSHGENERLTLSRLPFAQCHSK